MEVSNKSIWSHEGFDESLLTPSMRIWGWPNLRTMKGFLPQIEPYTLGGDFQPIDDLLKAMPVNLAKGEKGLLGQNQFRKAADGLFDASQLIQDAIQEYEASQDETQRNQIIFDLAMLFRDYQYLKMGYLFEGVHHGEAQAASKLPVQIANPLVILACLFEQKPWLEYASGYVLLNSLFGDEILADQVKLQRMWHGGSDEFFFQTVHSVIEWQTPKAFEAIADILEAIDEVSSTDVDPDLVFSSDQSVKARISDALDRGIQATQLMLDHLKTMTRLSRPAYYSSDVRPQIQGLVGNCGEGKLFGGEGVFFESDQIHTLDADLAQQQTEANGGWINSIRGQTGAQSSIIPLLDNFLGVHLFYASGENALTQMLREFRSYRPKPHTALLEAVESESVRLKVFERLKDHWPLQHAQWVSMVAQFREFHYYLAMAYIVKPGHKAPKNQSRAVGTGGSPTPRYLPQHLCETLDALKVILKDMDLSNLSTDELSLANELKIYSEKTQVTNQQRANVVGDYLDGNANIEALDEALESTKDAVS